MPTGKPAEYRRFAEECRMRARLAADIEHRLQWTQLAEQWEALAISAEKARASSQD